MRDRGTRERGIEGARDRGIKGPRDRESARGGSLPSLAEGGRELAVLGV